MRPSRRAQLFAMQCYYTIGICAFSVLCCIFAMAFSDTIGQGGATPR